MATKRHTPRRHSNNKGQKHHPLTTLLLFVAVAAALYGARTVYARHTPDHIGLTAGQYDLLHPTTNPRLDQTIIEYEAMTVSFNPSLHIPNWVSWELLASEVDGQEPRYNKFATDPDVTGCATTRDYTGSGYDRGHIAPAADMKWSPEVMRQSFLMTNICPQLHSLNSGTWKSLEEKCRQWAMADSAIIIIAGPVNTDPIDEYIGETGVAVPQRFFKVVASPWANPPRGIAFIMPNGRVPGGMQAAAVTIDSVESITGHDFFPTLPDSLQHIIESQCRFNYWSNLKPTTKP